MATGVVMRTVRHFPNAISLRLWQRLRAMALPCVLVAFGLTADPASADESWDTRIDEARARFKVLDSFAGEAVLDRETGLVWARHPGEAPEPDRQQNWSTAIAECYARDIGGRRGWRLPTLEELASLIDPRSRNPALAQGHPFRNVHSANYWSATTRVDAQGFVWHVDFGSGFVGNTFSKAQDLAFTWCVRGGKGIDGVQ